MSTLAWTDDLALQHPQMDLTHQEFVALLAEAEAARAPGQEARLLEAFQTLVDHTVAHFGQEDRWMAATGFAPENCHAFQHQSVLQVMQECERRARAETPDFEPLRIAVHELAIWFPQHARMMDAALAQHMAAVGFDPDTGRCTALPVAAGEPALTGCGSGSCG